MIKDRFRFNTRFSKIIKVRFRFSEESVVKFGAFYFWITFFVRPAHARAQTILPAFSLPGLANNRVAFAVVVQHPVFVESAVAFLQRSGRRSAAASLHNNAIAAFVERLASTFLFNNAIIAVSIFDAHRITTLSVLVQIQLIHDCCPSSILFRNKAGRVVFAVIFAIVVIVVAAVATYVAKGVVNGVPMVVDFLI